MRRFKSVGAVYLHVAIWLSMLCGMASTSAVRAAPSPVGDTIITAIHIDGLPFCASGTTIGYADDYDMVCPVGGPAPDVCYTYTPEYDMVVSVDLCGSAYDTKVYVFDESMSEIACNDDYYTTGETCGEYVSRIDAATLGAEVEYYIVVDGYASAAGDYELTVKELVPCTLSIPLEYVEEGEPALHDGYEDMYNGGCGSPEFSYPITQLDGGEDGRAYVHGHSGWYDEMTRDQDWYSLRVDDQGAVTVGLTTEHLTLLVMAAEFECGWNDWDIKETVERCDSAAVEIAAAPGATIWVAVMPREHAYPFDQVGHEYDYLLDVEGIMGNVAVERRSWGAIKALFEQ